MDTSICDMYPLAPRPSAIRVSQLIDMMQEDCGWLVSQEWHIQDIGYWYAIQGESQGRDVD